MHLDNDLDGAIDYYHQSLSRKPDDPFASEMLNRALTDALNQKLFLESPAPQFEASLSSPTFGRAGRADMARAAQTPNQSVNESSMMTDEGISMESAEDVDMSLTS